MIRALFVALGLMLWLLMVVALTGRGESGRRQAEVEAGWVVSQIERMQELATLRVNVSGVVHAEQMGRRWWQGSSRMAVIVRGSAIFSVDVAVAEVHCRPGVIHIALPEPKVLAHWVDVEESVIWKRERGRFRSEDEQELEAACWSAAKRIIYDAAQSDQHRLAARAVAERVVRSVVAGHVEDEILITWPADETK